MKNSVLSWLDETAKRLPNKLALQDISGNITYQEYRSKSLAIAYKIVELNKGEMKKPIVVYLEKGKEVLVSFMGVAYSGCFYSPIDTEMPQSRVDKILEVLKPEIVITTNKLKTNFEKFNFYGSYIIYEETICSEEDETAVKPYTEKIIDTDLLYVLFTSGSTGVPKGVSICHRSVIDYTDWVTETFNITQKDTFGNQAPFYFDNSILDIYSCMKTGATLNIIPKKLFFQPVPLLEYIKYNKINTIFWVPSALIVVSKLKAFRNVDLSDTLKRVLFCGEVMPNKQLNIWRKFLPNVTYANLYGPTEITDACTYYIVDREYENHETLPIGKVCRNMRALILNDDDKQCAVGEQGELCISGTGIALGYWNSPEITAKAFVQNPLNTKYYDRIYRTGDLVYENEEGNIIFIGRKDSQIKLRGNRIELGDLESAAAAIENVASACALFDADQQEIVLFIETTAEIVARKFKVELKKYVPAYMVPGKIVTMEKFPHTPSGKIDRVGLRKEYIN